MTRVKLLFLEGYFSSSWLSACGKAPVNLGQYVEITMACVPLSPLQACASNRLPMLFLQVGITADWRSPKWGVNSKSGQNLQNGVGSLRFHHWLWLQPIVIDLHFKITLYKLNIVSSLFKIKKLVASGVQTGVWEPLLNDINGNHLRALPQTVPAHGKDFTL